MRKISEIDFFFNFFRFLCAILKKNTYLCIVLKPNINVEQIKIRMIMKKIMMIAALMVAAVSAKAQFEPGTFSLQPKAGFALTTVTGEGTSFKPGFTAGLEAQYQINNWFGLSAGALYTTAGYKVKDAGDYKLNTGYVNIPVMAKFYVTKGLSLNAGLQLGFMIFQSQIQHSSLNHFLTKEFFAGG